MKNAKVLQRIGIWMLTVILVLGLWPGEIRKVEAADNGASISQNLSQETVLELEKRILAAWEAHSPTCDISDLDIHLIEKGSVQEVYFGLLYKNPQIFYVGLTMAYSYSYDVDGVSGMESSKIFKAITINYTYNAAKAAAMKAQLDKAVNKAVKGIDSKWSQLEKALYLHDYLCLNCQYDTTLKKYTAYDALVSKKAMCQGYSQAYILLLQKAGIESYMVYSKSLVHAWNLVKVNNVWYHVDVTWDDPTPDRMGRAKHEYFLKSASSFGTDKMHSKYADWKIFNGADPHMANTRTYDKALWGGMDTAFFYLKGKWYNYDVAKKAIYRYTCNGKKFKRSKKIKSLKSVVWKVFGSSASVYNDKFVGTGAYGKYFYYSTPTEVWRVKAGSKKAKKFFKLTKKQKKKGYIYGLFITNTGKLKILVSKSSNTKGKTYTVKSL